ncbi:MAG TPA: FGGY family carbohydrate kinase [Candidatus Latescibacteria bacterium]|nr:FGGY family carbohydrate kinase [Candidatus Latescibacterota bacterium]HJP29480.1 FGGY family carbohydrate kinase [Candidatus Latescibacterota bacterium]
MTHFLAVDFGTTSTKSALVDLHTGRFSHLRRHAALQTTATAPGHHEVDLQAIRQRFEAICTDAWTAVSFDGIVLCSEMHGFAVLDPDSGTPLTEYISWLDGRSVEVVAGVRTIDAVRERLGDDRFRTLTGMRPRPGFPLLNLIHLARTRSLPEEVVVVSLPGWLAGNDAGSSPPEHPTILAGMALYDVVAAEPAAELLEVVYDIGGVRPRIGAPAADDAIAGHWSSPDGDDVPIHVGVGDHQCSVLGAGVATADIASVNLGTGSQVGLVDGPLDDSVEHRPFFDSRHLSAVTHIPSGRALAEYVGFLQQAVSYGRGAGDTPPDMWQALAEIGPQEVARAELSVDLAVFDGARGWSDGGRISGIVEGGLTPTAYLASVLKAYSLQYVEVLDRLDPERSVRRVALSGGIARNLPHLAQIIASASGRQVDGTVDLDESLLGLRALALRCAGLTDSVAEGQSRFGRECHMEETT